MTVRGKTCIQRAAFAGLLLCALASAALAQAVHPVIFIPGVTGSELRNPTTNERIWFSALKPRSGRIALTLDADPARMHDDLVATDVVRSLKVGFIPVDIYGGFIKALASRGGYHEEKWGEPGPQGDGAAVYVFAYDWRQDNVSNARLLVRKIAELRKKLGRPDLKFDIVAHSMGGIIARYAAMYGDADLPAAGRRPEPSWAGSRLFDHVILLGTPNEGAVNSLNALVNGFEYRGLRVDLPFLQDTSRFTVFSIPSAYQLLPAPGTLRAFDDHLRPLDVDIYDTKTWTRYGWDISRSPDLVDHFTAPERRVAGVYFANALSRAKRLHEALAAAGGQTSGMLFYAVGTDCKNDTRDGVVLYRGRSGDWNAEFDPAGFTRADGSRVSDSQVAKVVLSPGDGIVPFHSVNASTESKRAGVPSIFGAGETENVCEEHNVQATNRSIQDHIIKILTGMAVAPKQLTAMRP